MIECRVCGANCDPGDLRQGVCEDCRNAEQEFHILPKTTDQRRKAMIERMERSNNTWQHCLN